VVPKKNNARRGHPMFFLPRLKRRLPLFVMTSIQLPTFLGGDGPSKFTIILPINYDVNINSADILVKEVDVYYLVNLIGAHAYKWKIICGQCGLLPSEIEAIGRDPVNLASGHSQCLAAGLTKWCNIASTDGSHCLDPRLDVLVKALRSSVVNEGILAQTILQHCDNLPSMKSGISVMHTYAHSCLLSQNIWDSPRFNSSVRMKNILS
jgi:hypothetical protein